MTIYRRLKKSNNQDVLDKLNRNVSKKEVEKKLNEVVIKGKNIKITKKQLLEWKRNNSILLVVECRRCSKIHEIKSRFYTYNCSCGQNLICWQTVNHAGSKVLHKHKELDGDSLKKYF